MTQLVYVSTARKPFAAADLDLLLVRARIVNASRSITGILLYHKGSFLQVLEGAEADVEATFSSIQRDPRHYQIKVLSREFIASREFDGWSMSFTDTGGWDMRKGFIGYSTIPDFVAAASNAKRYLRLFHLGLWRDGLLG